MTRHSRPLGPPWGSYAKSGRISSRGAAATQPPGAVAAVGVFVSAAVPSPRHPIREAPAMAPVSTTTTNLRRLALHIVLIVGSLSLAAVDWDGSAGSGCVRKQLFRTDCPLSSRYLRYHAERPGGSRERLPCVATNPMVDGRPVPPSEVAMSARTAELEIRVMPVADLVPAPYNPRRALKP